MPNFPEENLRTLLFGMAGRIVQNVGAVTAAICDEEFVRLLIKIGMI
jgi:hypothetical protein